MANAGPLLLLDGNSLAYRAFFALPTDMVTASGQVTNALFGFTSMLVNLVSEHQPSAIGVAFDRPEPTFRHTQVPTYKANRAESPDILRQQMGILRQVVETLGIRWIEAPGFEADDILATLATMARDAQREVVVVTGDRDAYQLVEDPYVKVLYNRRGVSDYVLYDEAGILERTGVTPKQYPAYAALRGDPSDNLPGVPGVGEKTAAKLITAYGDLAGVYSHLDELRPKVRAALEEHRDQVEINGLAMPLVRDVPLDLSLEDLERSPCQEEEVRRLFGFFEFRSLLPRALAALGGGAAGVADGDGAGQGTRPQVVVDRPASTADAVSRIEELGGGSGVAVVAQWSGLPGRSEITGLALMATAAVISPGERATPSPGAQPPRASAVWIAGPILSDLNVLAALGGLLGPGGPELTTHHAKEMGRRLAQHGIDLVNLGVDVAVAGYVADPSEDAYDIAGLARRYLGWDLAPGTAAPQGQLDLGGDEDEAGDQAALQALAVADLGPYLWRVLGERGQADLYAKVERPLVRVLTHMELVGVQIDVTELEGLVAALGKEAAELNVEIQALAGGPFNVGSTPQLRQVLYDRLGLAPIRKTKTGYSTDAATLERLRGQHPIVEAILRYREVEKLRSTFGVGLLAETGPDQRIHATFNQTVARTGRLSSDRPNLHNIPIRSEEGRRFRKAFVPAPGFQLLVADYDQIELRVIAHLSHDPGLIEAFRNGLDIHAETASRIFGVPAAAVTPAMRSKAKMVSYGLAYGMEAYGLSQRLGVPIAEADQILRAFFDGFPKVRAYMDATIAQARERGYTETPFGRRRQIPELSSSNFRVRQAGERQAMNAGIQGLAADLFKIALLALDERLAHLESRVVLQVHDEVIVEVKHGEEDQVGADVKDALENAASLSVPLSVHLAWGNSWEEAKG